MVRIRKGRTSVWVEVFDSDLRLPRIRVAGENDEGGRGLYLVEQLARRWGSRPTDEGKAVWFEMPIKPPAAGSYRVSAVTSWAAASSPAFRASRPACWAERANGAGSPTR